MHMVLQDAPDFIPTRYMGSKRTILHEIWQVARRFQFLSILDAFSGSGCVSHMFKRMGKQVFANDYLKYSYTIALATVENSTTKLSEQDVEFLLSDNPKRGTFVQDMFQGVYFTDMENRWIDNTLANIADMDDHYKIALARAALARACLKKRPRGVFTYTGNRYDDGRRDLRVTLADHFREAIEAFNSAVFDNGQDNQAMNLDVFDVPVVPDMVYMDPPYYTPHSDNDYLRRYHFLEGLCCAWQGVEILHNTKTKKLKKYPTPFDSKAQVYDAFRRLFDKFRESVIVLSYSSNGLPGKSELSAMLHEVKPNVQIHEVSHTYSFGTHGHKNGNRNNRVKEYIFTAW